MAPFWILIRRPIRFARYPPVAPHPKIVSVGKYFILCADFRDTDGKAVNIDFYVTRKNGRFLIFQTQVDQRERLSAFVKSHENRR